MRFEHAAIDVADPVAFVRWYEEHLGLRVVLHMPEPFQTHFLADEAGSFCFEVYRNPSVETPDYRLRSPVLFHMAFVSENPTADAARLIAVGATSHSEIRRPDAHLILLQDPWGVSLQLCRRDASLV